MTRKVLYLGLILMFAMTGGCAGLRNIAPYPSARVAAVEMGGFGLTSVTIDFKVEVENPYVVDLPVVGLGFALSTEGKQFLEGHLEPNRTIPAGGSAFLDVPIKIPFLQLYDVISGVEPGATVPYKADFALTVDAPVIGAVTLPIDATGELTLPGSR